MAWWRKPLLLLLMAGMGSLALLAGLQLYRFHWMPMWKAFPPSEREQFHYIAFLEFLGLFMGSLFGAGTWLARTLKLMEDSIRLSAMSALWTAILGLPAGVLLLYLRFGDVARTRLPAVEIWVMTALAVALIASGLRCAAKAWRLRAEILAFYR